MQQSVDDIEAIYGELSPRLRSIVSRNVTAPAPLIEEAVQIAWSRWVIHRESVARASVLAWLATTATREALRMVKAQRREVALDDLGQHGEVIEFPAPGPGPDRVVELREQLAEIHRLPVRQQRMVWLHGLGYDYNEIAGQTGDTRRTVERQLLRAKRKLAAPAGGAGGSEPTAGAVNSERAAGTVS